MKKFISLITVFVLIIGVLSLSACSDGNTAANEENGAKPFKIVTTVFPVYDWVKNVIRGNDNAELTMLLDKGVDLHSYQPTADDMAKISDCDIFVYVGGESDDWVEDALKNAKNAKALNLLEALGDKAKEEEIKEGMQEEEEGEEGEEETEYDEHIWLSLKNAQALVEEIKDVLCGADPDNAPLYTANTEKYISELSVLDSEYAAAVEAAPTKTLLFGDRFPFRYMTEDYNLDYYAAFAGCSAETEASFETISFLAQKADELSLKNIAVLEGTDHKITQTIIENSQSKQLNIVSFDSMQSKTAEDVKSGATYLDIMRGNLNSLKEALN